MSILFYILAAMLIWFSFKSFRGGIDYLNYFKRELAKPRSSFTPFVTVIAPCKGLDEDLEANLAALVEQDHPGYEVIFVVDDENDAAVPIIRKTINRRGAESLRKANPPQIDTDKHRSNKLQEYEILNSAARRFCGEIPAIAKLVVAQKATGSSQKVENLREAVLKADSESQIFVFVDSDTRPAREWLRNLIAPLEDGSIGAATGYRWFISNRPTFASEMRNIWNASIASALGPNTQSNFCWGGSLAIRREIFEKLDIREKWRGTLSDDFAVTRALNAAKMPIVFVPQALTASIEDCTFREMFEFTTRQMKITRVYASHLWLMSFFGSGLFIAVMIVSLLIVIVSRRNTAEVWAALATLILVTILSIGKSWLRLAAVKLVLTEHTDTLRRQFRPQSTLWLIAPVVFFYNCVAALFSRRINWRGTVYEMVSPTVTLVVPNDERQIEL